MTESQKVIAAQTARLQAIEEEQGRIIPMLDSASILGKYTRDLVAMRYEGLKDACKRRIMEEQENLQNERDQPVNP